MEAYQNFNEEIEGKVLEKLGEKMVSVGCLFELASKLLGKFYQNGEPNWQKLIL